MDASGQHEGTPSDAHRQRNYFKRPVEVSAWRGFLKKGLYPAEASFRVKYFTVSNEVFGGRSITRGSICDTLARFSAATRLAPSTSRPFTVNRLDDFIVTLNGAAGVVAPVIMHPAIITDITQANEIDMSRVNLFIRIAN